MRPETRHSIVLTGGVGLTAALAVLYTVYAGRLLGPAGYADFTAAVSLVAMCYIALGPINGTVARFTAQYAHHDQYGKVLTLAREVTRRVAWYGLLGIGAGLLVVRPLTQVLRFESGRTLLVAYGLIYLTLLLNVPRGVLRGVQRFGQLNVNTVAEAGVRLGSGVVLLHLLRTAVAGLFAYVVGLAVALAASVFQLRRIWRGHAPQALDGAEVRRFTGPMFVMMLTAAAFQHADMLFVKHYFAASVAGVYGAAFTLARSITVLFTPFQTLALPLLTTLYEQGEGRSGSFLRVSGYFLALAVGPVLLFWLWAEPIVVAFYGADFRGGAAYLLGITAARIAGFLAELIALLHITRGSFRFLYIYLSGLLVEMIALLVWHGTLATVVRVMLLAQTATVAALVLHLALGARGRPASRSGPR